MIKVLDFWADWCHPCKVMEPVLAETEKQLAGKVIIEKINVDQNPAKASEFGVMSIPTYIIIKDNQEIDRMIGATSKENFSNFVK